MYKNDIYEILENKLLAKDVYRMILKGDTKYIKLPGQFINIKVEGCYLRRPISVILSQTAVVMVLITPITATTEATDPTTARIS